MSKLRHIIIILTSIKSHADLQSFGKQPEESERQVKLNYKVPGQITHRLIHIHFRPRYCLS